MRASPHSIIKLLADEHGTDQDTAVRLHTSSQMLVSPARNANFKACITSMPGVSILSLSMILHMLLTCLKLRYSLQLAAFPPSVGLLDTCDHLPAFSHDLWLGQL